MPPVAKKKPKRDPKAQSDKEHLSVYLPPDIAKRLRIQAVAEGKRYSVLIEEFVAEGLARRGS